LKVGVQRKTLSDFIQSMTTVTDLKPRLIRQAEFLTKNYDLPILLLCGWRSLYGREGFVRTSGWESRWRNVSIEMQLLRLQEIGIFRVECPSDNPIEQARLILALKSHTEKMGSRSLSAVLLPMPPLAFLDKNQERVLANLVSFEGIGYKTAEKILKKLRTLRNVYSCLLSSPEPLLAAEGVGRTLLKKMVDLLDQEFTEEI